MVGTVAKNAGELSGNALDALFKAAKFALRIPTGADSATNRWTALDIVDQIPSRKFLYHGERLTAYLLATIPNFEQVRWSLATEMRRTEAPELVSNELGLSADEVCSFFSTLKFRVAVYESKVPLAASSTQQMQQHIASPIANRGSTLVPLPLERAPQGFSAHSKQVFRNKPNVGQLQTRRPVATSSMPSYVVSIDGTLADKLLVERSGDGSWHCVFPFLLNTPTPAETSELLPVDDILSFEIRVACTGVDDMLLAKSSDQPVDPLTYNDRSVQLEELAAKLSSGVSISEHTANGYSKSLMPAATKAAANMTSDTEGIESLPVLPRRMFQAVVTARPMVQISSRVVSMPRSFGSDNMLVEISVFREENSGPDVTLHSVDADSPYWYVVGVGAIESVPLLLGKGSCWKSIFRVCPLNRSTTRATAPGLNLLSTTAYTAESPTSVDKSTAYITIHALCSTGDETSHLLDVSQRVQLPTASERELDIVADNYGLESGTAIPTAATDASLSSSRNSMQHRRPSTANTAYGRRSTAVDQIRSPGSKSAVAATFERTSSHMRNVSLDTLAHPTRPSARKLSIAHPQSQNQPEMLSASSMSSQYGGSMTMRRGHLRNSRSSAMGDFEPGSLGRLRGNQVVAEEQQLQADMRGRSATMAAPNLRSPTSPRQAFQRQSLSGVSTLLANSSHPYTQTLPPTLPEVAESRVSAESQKRPGVACASISEPAPDPEASVVDIGTISISFDAPSMAMLGEEFVVRVHISNNTNVHYFRLALLDISRRGEQLAVAEDDDQPDLSPGLLSLDHSTEIPPLRPGESASVALRYIAAEPHFHSIKMLRLLNLDADIADKSLFAIESPFVVFVDDSSR